MAPPPNEPTRPTSGSGPPRARVVPLLPADATAEERWAFLAEELEDRPMQGAPGPYPCVVTRHFPGVYRSRPVVWDDDAGPNAAGPVRVPCAAPFDEGGRLRAEARAIVVRHVRDEAAASGFKQCAVFGEHDAVYVDPDGASRASTDPPRWGRTITQHP